MTSTKTTTTTLRTSTLESLGLGTVLEMFKNGQRPVDAEKLVGKVFGPKDNRGAMVISGASGIVGAGKTMQFASRLAPYGVKIVALDFPGAPDGIGKQYPGLVRAFGHDGAAKIMSNVIRMSYDGKSLPDELKAMKPRFLLEAIPEILEVKKAHYELFRREFPDIQIRSVTSGFPSKELGVGVAHPAFPHEINKMFEVVEEDPSDITRLLWSLGLIPVAVSDDWSFVLDVLFCGIMNASIRYHHESNMPYWKIDKFIRKYVGPNPFRAHDAIGAKGANFLTWSCLHHLGEQYGEPFTPAPELVTHKNTGADWYPPNHFRPMVDWPMDDEDEFKAWILGPLFQMATLMVKEERSHLAQLNLIGEICAQFRSGILASLRQHGASGAKEIVARYHELYPAASKGPWFPEQLDKLESPEWQQLYVNAEHDGTVGVITIGRESYNYDVDAEMNRAIDWLRDAGINSVIVTGDLHLTTQLVGADTSEFYPALEDAEAGARVSNDWSRTARRLRDDFDTSVGVILGKRCLGGMLELLLHCDYLVAESGTSIGFPEVGLPVVPGMEGCHWPHRKTDDTGRKNLMEMLLGGQFKKAADTVGWFVDFAGTEEDVFAEAWKMATGSSEVPRRDVETGPVAVPTIELPPMSPETETARRAIRETVEAACAVSLDEALAVQTRHSAEFMVTPTCRGGVVGSEWKKVMKV